MKFIENLEKLMSERNISAYRLEKDTGIRQTVVNSWKKGSSPSADKIELLVQYFEVSSDYLLFGKNQEYKMLKPLEEKLLINFRQCDRNSQEAVLMMCEKLSPKTEQSSNSKIG